MNLKKIVAVFALAIVLAGCVVAAGCVNSNSTSAIPSTSLGQDGITGTWVLDTEPIIQMMKTLALSSGVSESELNLDELRKELSDTGSYQFNADGSGKEITEGVEYPITWKSLGDNKFVLISDGKEVEMVFSPETGSLSDASGFIVLKKTA